MRDVAGTLLSSVSSRRARGSAKAPLVVYDVDDLVDA
jgi:hypothetical protein